MIGRASLPTPSSPLFKTLRRLVRRQWVLTQESAVPTDAPVEVAPPPGVLIRPATADDAAALAPLVRGEPVERRLTGGDIAVVAEVDGRLVGCCWLANRPLRVAFLCIKVKPRAHRWYGYGGYVLREFRGRGIHPALQRARLREAQRLGVSSLWGHVYLPDARAVTVHRRFGWVPMEESFGLVLLNRFAITLWRRRLDHPGRRPLMPTAPR
jgi:GNAT superfamily N-acetyltransferase